MASRRMISKDIYESDQFFELEYATQMLYVRLMLAADDEGVIANPKMVLRMTGVGIDHLHNLVGAGLIYYFAEANITVIRHWWQQNCIQNDRRKESVHKAILTQLSLVDGVYYWHAPAPASQPESAAGRREYCAPRAQAQVEYHPEENPDYIPPEGPAYQSDADYDAELRYQPVPEYDDDPAEYCGQSAVPVVRPPHPEYRTAVSNSDTSWNQSGVKLDTECIQNVSKLEPQDRVDQYRLAKQRSAHTPDPGWAGPGAQNFATCACDSAGAGVCDADSCSCHDDSASAEACQASQSCTAGVQMPDPRGESQQDSATAHRDSAQVTQSAAEQEFWRWWQHNSSVFVVMARPSRMLDWQEWWRTCDLTPEEVAACMQHCLDAVRNNLLELRFISSDPLRFVQGLHRYRQPWRKPDDKSHRHAIESDNMSDDDIDRFLARNEECLARLDGAGGVAA